MDKFFYNGQIRRLEKISRIYEWAGSPYRIEEYGSTKVFYGDYGQKRYYNTSNTRIEGFHLSRVARQDLEKRLASKEYTYMNQDAARRHVKTVFYSKKGCMANRGAMLTAIDINSCYWETAHNIGAIGDRAYNLGYKKDNYKYARNVAIGSLGRVKRITTYIPGIGHETSYEALDTNRARLDIIDYVWNMAVKVASGLGDNFCFFLTDCFYVDEKHEQETIKAIEAYNYSCKAEKHRLIGIEKKSPKVEAVHWERMEPGDKNQYGIHQFNHNLELSNILKDMGVKPYLKNTN